MHAGSFGEQERSARIARGESRVAVASLVFSKQNGVFEQGKRFS